MKFVTPQEGNRHSLQTLDALYRYEDFMESICTMVDLGCGSGDDLMWWATRTTQEDNPKPLNIQCTGVDITSSLAESTRHPNLVFYHQDFEEPVPTTKGTYDVLWCYDAFQYCLNPIKTLSQWWYMASDSAMLALIIPQTTNISQKQLAFTQPDRCYYHHTLVSLIHHLAVSGWDCQSGFFLKKPTDPWIHAVVYKSQHKPLDPKTTSWHDLHELGLLPASASASVYAHNELRQQDLILPWLDKSLSILAKQ